MEQQKDIREFTQKLIASKLDRLLMTNALNAHSDASISVEDFCLSTIQPLIELLSLSHKTLTQAEYAALEFKKPGTLYIIKEGGKIIRTYIGSNPLTDGETFFCVVDDYWQVSQDGGLTFTDVLDNSGKKVSAKGDKVILRLVLHSGIEYKYESETDAKFRLLIPIADLKLKFSDLTPAEREIIRGENVYLQKSATHIQWKIGTGGKWMDLVALAELKGDKGDAAVLRRSGNYIQTKNELGAWVDLYNIREVASPVEIVNELGQKTDAAVSQKLLTDSLEGVSTTLGGLENVDPEVDNEPSETRFLVEKVGGKTWKYMNLSELEKLIGGGGGGGEGGGATTLGGLRNVVMDADTVLDEDYVLVKLAGSDTWVLKLLSELGSGGGTTIQRNVRVSNNLESKNISASKGEPCLLQFTFISQERYGYDEPYEDTGERGLCEISIKNTESADFTIIKEMYIQSGSMYTFDCAEFLTSGANNIMIKVKGEITMETTPAFVYTVQLTSLSLSAHNFAWWTAYASDFNIPLNIGGNVSKTLYVAIHGENYKESYQVVVGTGIYTETAYNYLVKHPLRTGVFNLSCYVSNSDGTIKTRTLSFNILCVETGIQKKLIAINNVLLKATNWSENNLFDYAMYDGDNVSTSAEFLIRKDGVKVFGSEEDAITTATKHSFSFPMEIDTIDNSDFNIDISVLDDSQELVTPLTIPVGNKAGYSAVAGATFYLNPRTRSNRQTNHQLIINEMNGSELAGQWENMTWGNDGWTTDVDGNNVLRLLAGSMLTIPHQPFSKECARTGKTIEWDYKIDNVTDYTEPVITVSMPVADSFVGLNIYADDIIMHTSALKNTPIQSIGTDTGVRIRMSLVILPMAYGNNGFNLCSLCINGKKVRTFAYANNDYFAQAGEIVIGSDFADVDLYGLRIYENGLTTGAILQNYINWLTDNDEKARVKLANDVLDANGVEIEYENAKDQYNVFVFDNTFPSFSNQANKTGLLELFFIDKPERNVRITNVAASGQGTSSKKYWEWNVKFKLDKTKSVVTYADGTTATKKFKMFDGVPACASATAKKNWASSMQDHKCGSVNAYTDVAKECGLTNEAIAQDAEVRLSVAQKPFIGFSKSINEEGETVYLCMGEFTFGPDKGDKYCFGYDEEKFPKLISIEGSDNAPLPALYRVPWTVARMVYNPDEEAWQYNGTNCFDFGGGLEDNIQDFIPAYNCVYQCSGRILPFNGTVDQLNAEVADYKNSGYEYWTNDHNLYYYEAAEGRFIASNIGEGTLNLVSQLVDKGYGLLASDLAGKTKEQLNALFIAAREKKFFMDAPQYWDVDDTLFHDNWVELFAGTDQRAKNTYPYSFGGKWKWRIDDADTIGPVDNQGQLTKGYSIETHDKTSTGAAIWNGETSVLHNLFETAFAARKVEMMRIMLSAMGDLGGLSSGTAYDKLYAFYQKYFLSVKEYFPHNAVNADARRYENAKLAYMAGIYTNDTDPITQSLGDAYSTETAWFKKRFLYIMSKYSFGTFSADGTDSIIVRAAGDTIQYEVTPAIDMYPAIANGTSIVRGSRTKAGEKCVMNIELGGSGDQQNAIQCASYLQDIGEWHNKNVRGTMTIKGRMLRYIRLGSKTQPILISISALTIADCVSLQELVLSNIVTLAGVLNLADCSHLRKVYADGTSLTQIQLPRGGALTVVEFSAYNQYLSLANYPLLTNEGVGVELCKGVITDFFVVDCPKMLPMKLLSEIIEAQSGQANHALKRVRTVGFNETYNNSDILDKLATLADGSYIGLSSDGLAGEDELPVLDGTLNVFADAYEQSIDALRTTFKKLVLNHTGKLYIKFEDSLVEQMMVSRFDIEKDGYLTKQEAIAATEIYGYMFENSAVKYFDELGAYFTNVTNIGVYAFRNSALERVAFPPNLKQINQNAFQNTKIRDVHLPDSVEMISGGTFRDCTLLKEVKSRGISAKLLDTFNGCRSLTDAVITGTYTIMEGYTFDNCVSLVNIKIADSVISMGNFVFRSCAFSSFDLPKSLQKMGNNAFEGCSNLKSISIPDKVISTGVNVFYKCTSLIEITVYPVVPPTIENNIFSQTHVDLKIYVPDSSVTAYKTATNWSQFAARIYPLSSKP